MQLVSFPSASVARPSLALKIMALFCQSHGVPRPSQLHCLLSLPLCLSARYHYVSWYPPSQQSPPSLRSAPLSPDRSILVPDKRTMLSVNAT
jgi:hypothetical protein